MTLRLHPAPTLQRVATGPALRVTRAQKAIAAAMNGATPAPQDLAAAAGDRLDAATLHLSAAAALRQALMSRPTSDAPRAFRRRIGAEQQTALDAYYLALALTDAATGDPAELAGIVTGAQDTWIAAAALVCKLEVRFLEEVCAQVDMAADRSADPGGLSARSPLRAVFAARGALPGGAALLDGHGAAATEDGSTWFHAHSSVNVAGRAGDVIVDAGPDTFPAQWSARMAAPVTLTAAPGRWPKAFVEDALRMCDSAIRGWVASMTRQFTGEGDDDLVLRIGPPLRRFLVSPAAAAIAAARQPHSAGTAAAQEVLSPHVIPMVPTPLARAPRRPGLLAEMRSPGNPGDELPADVALPGSHLFTEIHRDELTLLSAADPGDLKAEVEVTVNFVVSEWQDVAALAEEARTCGAVTLTSPLLVLADQDVVAGDRRRLALRVRTSWGIPVHVREGYGVVLPAGSQLQVIGADILSEHATIYAVHIAEPGPDFPEGTRDEP